MKKVTNDSLDAEIARMIEGMDFSDDPEPPPKAPSMPQVFITKLLPDGTVVVYGSRGGYWSELGEQSFMSSPAEALAFALDTTSRKYKAQGETSQWMRYSSDEFSRSISGTQCTVKRVGGGWMAEVRTHTAQGWFSTAQEAMAAADKRVPTYL